MIWGKCHAKRNIFLKKMRTLNVICVVERVGKKRLSPALFNSYIKPLRKSSIMLVIGIITMLIIPSFISLLQIDQKMQWNLEPVQKS